MGGEKINAEDVKHDENPDADESTLDFGDELPGAKDDADDEQDDGAANAEAAAAAAKARKNGDEGKPAGKAPAKGAAEAAAEGEEDAEGEEADASGDGDGDDADAADDEESVRAAGAAARRAAETNGDRAGWVPPHRLREATRAARAAENRVRELEAEAARLRGTKDTDPVKALEGQLDGLYEKVEEARAEGRTADAAKMQREIDKINREVSGIAASRTATAQALEVAQVAAYEATVEEIETKFPELNPDNEALFDAELAQEVLDLAAGFRAAKKMPHAAALKKALSYVFKEEYLDTGTAHLYVKGSKGEKKDDKSGEKKDDKSGEKKAAERKSAQVKANLKANERQPAPLGDAGKVAGDTVKYDLKNMTDEEFEALPESTKARLRGDFLAA